jgi:hypothetical protein
MKTRHGLVSNSSSTSFMIHTKDIKDEELYSGLMCVINEGNYIAPIFEDRTILHVSTGQADGPDCLFRWWKINKWLIDNKIYFQSVGDGCPNGDEIVRDIIWFLTCNSDEHEPDLKKVQELKDWYHRNIPNKRIEMILRDVGLTKEDIKKDLDHGNPDMVEMYADLIKE